MTKPKPVAWRWGAAKLRGVEWRYTSKKTRQDAQPLYDQSALDAAVAAERERCGVLTNDMLRYAMAALGTGSPQEAERFRAFWLHAMTARSTGGDHDKA